MLKEKIEKDLSVALKERNQEKVSTLRMILSAVHNREIEKRHRASDEDVIKILSSEQKKHLDSIEQFQKGGRADLVAKEQAELGIVRSYLPEGLRPDEIEGLIRETIQELGASGSPDFGKVMKAVMAKAKGRADGAVVSQMVKEELK